MITLIVPDWCSNPQPGYKFEVPSTGQTFEECGGLNINNNRRETRDRYSQGLDQQQQGPGERRNHRLKMDAQRKTGQMLKKMALKFEDRLKKRVSDPPGSPSWPLAIVVILIYLFHY
ncbi:hypothetical protein CDAR_459571 [Caerostris darwini]|uniref:Uncharacterized protein n=1 Tax=Caerostris darwini TaxID=1538125 RepID=A0AAV4UT97_9ARAC|nr:hypothetical protein CDAR_459571 [Caerostris darwini]